MRVICVDASPGVVDGVKPPFHESEILEIRESERPKHCFIITYPDCGAWSKSRFIPLSEIDETQLQSHTVKDVQL